MRLQYLHSCDHLLVCRVLAGSDHKSAGSLFTSLLCTCVVDGHGWRETFWDGHKGDPVTPGLGYSKSIQHAEPLLPQREQLLYMGAAASDLKPLYQHYEPEVKRSLHRPPTPVSASLVPSPGMLEQIPAKPLWLESCCQVILKSL